MDEGKPNVVERKPFWAARKRENIKKSDRQD